MSIAAYRARLEEALQALGSGMRVDFVESWHTEPQYLEGIAARVRQAMVCFGDGERVLVVFTAHSLPVSIVERGDPYPAQLHETARLLADMLHLPEDRWTFSYQSAGRTGTAWLDPQIGSLVPALAQRGERNLLIAPVGFIADHVEVLYDLDIEVQRIAVELGIQVVRTEMLNDSPVLVNALGAIVRRRLSAPASLL
jgi:ferrochelatase